MVRERTTVDWLHVPKTGSSFLYVLLIYACDHLEGYVADLKARDVNKIREEERWGVEAKNYDEGCMKAFIHTPLRQGMGNGHRGFLVENVFTILRAPSRRVVSGFLHTHHSCPMKWFYHNHSKGPVRKSKSCPEWASPSMPDAAVVGYARCSGSCQTRMIIGQSCGHSTAEHLSDQRAEAMVIEAKSKIDRFAFVGLTDRWSESMCLFAKRFPRSSGKPYPSKLVNHNMRPTKHDDCESRVASVLHEDDASLSQDALIFAHAERRFERELDRYSECREGGRRLNQTSWLI